MSSPLPTTWLKQLKLSERTAPDFINKSDTIELSPYSAFIRKCFDDIGIDAIFCIDRRPTVAFYNLSIGIDHISAIQKIHQALWSQGILELLIVIQEDVLRIYSLNTRPKSDDGFLSDNSDKRLLRVFSLTDNALSKYDLLESVESGRFVRDHPNLSDDSGKINVVLLKNLQAARRFMEGKGLAPNDTAAILIQVMFLAYLRDREIIDNEYLATTVQEKCFNTINDIFKQDTNSCYDKLQNSLDKDFNGGIFKYSFSKHWNVVREVVLDFLEGRLDMESRQYYLYSYNFKFIPIELISEVYDALLSSDANEKKSTGSYYTPRFLAQIISDQAITYFDKYFLSNSRIDILDPACGSGIFLVSLFHYLIEQLRSKKNGNLTWKELVDISRCLHGIDKNPTAILIAAFSLSIALLDQVSPPQIQKLRDHGKILPLLIGKNLTNEDFFNISLRKNFDLIIGNPPWGENKGSTSSAELWCEKNKKSIPNRDMAWPFIWKSLKHLKRNGIVSFLLPTTSIFFNSRARSSIQKFTEDARILRLINLSDMRYLLFKGAKQPSIITVYSKNNAKCNYDIELYSPRVDLNFMNFKQLLLSHQDKKTIKSNIFFENPIETLKLSMGGGNRSLKLYNYLSKFDKISHRVKGQSQNKKGAGRFWTFGRGFQPVTSGISEKYKPHTLSELSILPYITADEINFLGIEQKKSNRPFDTTVILFDNFSEGFYGPHILFPEGVSSYRIKACYTEQNLSFNKSINVIKFPNDESNTGKVLAAILCSILSSWYMLQCSQLGISRPRIQREDILNLPFPMPHDLPDPEKSTFYFNKISKYMDKFIDIDHSQTSYFPVQQQVYRLPQNALNDIDDLVFEYFGLVENEKLIVRETFDYTIKSIQPNIKSNIPLLNNSTPTNWENYCNILEAELQKWINNNHKPSVGIVGASRDIVIVRVSLTADIPRHIYTPDNTRDILSKLFQKLPKKITRNIYFLRSLMIFLDDDLYIAKPIHLRFWLSQAAMDDSDKIASEILSSIYLSKGHNQ